MFEYLSSFVFFNIGLSSFNLFSLIIGLMIAFFLRGIFNRTLGLLIFVYWISLAGWYAGNLYLERHINARTAHTQVVK